MENNSIKSEETESECKQHPVGLWLVMEVKFDAVKSNTSEQLGMLGPSIKGNWKWSNRRCQERTLAF